MNTAIGAAAFIFSLIFPICFSSRLEDTLCAELGLRVIERNPQVREHLASTSQPTNTNQIFQAWPSLKDRLPEPTFGPAAMLPSAESVHFFTEEILHVFSHTQGVSQQQVDKVTANVNNLYSRIVRERGLPIFIAALGEAVAVATRDMYDIRSLSSANCNTTDNR